MKPIQQTIVNVDLSHNTVMVESAKGNRYPVSLNHYCKTINVGDEALVTKSLNGDWILIDVEPKYPRPLDVTEFPRDNNGCLNIVEHCKYLKLIESMPESKRVALDNHLIRTFIDKYGMVNQLAHRRSQL